MNVSSQEAANLLGAVGLLVAGAVRGAVTGAVGAGGALGEALIAIKDQPGRTADWLAEVLHISQPGTAHLVRRITEQGLVVRDTSGRARPLRLTEEGERVAAEALAARQAVLDRLVERLSDRQRAQLVAIAGALLGPEARSEHLLAELCRLCDRSTCPRCPVHRGWQRACSG
ncbi:MarR family winged helix-turn-helix transcriptional regulator [Saccharothrix australiensis]|uniref:DNA-binding MarR family transcriptional regulator n=1 Tax=Saccharothrix australiensis TaxID=2072 RepID=A0A495W454_9PSEU|nr:MarR family winged helix-turn-helix transcriptional regulator [Saccharothrix australiensis]RKT54578.1 DNA-binding MarR family transcriptional regulator [Saccharothrix australiensis]